MLPPAICDSSTRIGRRLVLNGSVQGLGLRPAIARFAVECGLAGSVSNRLYGVEAVIEGAASEVLRFEQNLMSHLPEVAQVVKFETADVAPRGFAEFRIEEDQSTGLTECRIPRDRAICPDCVRDLQSSTNRRYGYPWTSCTSCGPRFSILSALPYERRLTTMQGFTFCGPCQNEYVSHSDRRFHSQTNACPVCGPGVWLVQNRRNISQGAEAVIRAGDALRKGGILAVRGVGGYQLLCDATSFAAVETLRSRKHRPSKPFAVLVKDMAAAEELTELSDCERKLLTSPENPIVLLTAHRRTSVASNVAPGLRRLGLMLPTSGLHWLLCEQTRLPLVATSGNGEGCPLAIDVETAERELAGVADLFLHHDRDIAHPVDDSVVQCFGGRPMLLRCGRGYAPLPLQLPPTSRPILATGGEQKSAWAVSNGKQSILGQYVGDLEQLSVRDRYLAVGEKLLSLCGAVPKVIVHDLHPDYFSTRWAETQKMQRFAVQHHHAHVVAGMIEAGWLNRKVLGIAFDGTGYGTDGSVWGGEFLIATADAFRRVACLRPFGVPGGTLAIREPWRVWVSLLEQVQHELPPDFLAEPFGRMSSEVELIAKLARNPNLSFQTTSAGRLFDGVAAYLLRRDSAEYDGHLPAMLEAACDPTADGSYSLELARGDVTVLDWRPLVQELLRDDSSSTGARAMRFHRGMAAGIARTASLFPELPVILTGGVFQNQILAGMAYDLLTQAGREVWLPASIPPNDGGLAAGQLAIAIANDQAADQSIVNPASERN